MAPSWLFFGCRREDEDFLYKDDLQGLVGDHTLTHLKVAFSRAQAEKVREQAERRKHWVLHFCAGFSIPPIVAHERYWPSMIKRMTIKSAPSQVYVQDLIKQHASDLATLIEAGAYIFVCGDGASMAKDVSAALQAAVRDFSGITDDEAAQRMAALVQEKRYIRDVWS